MTFEDRSDRFCIIGAGAAGITAAKNLKAQGFKVDVLEKEDDIGGTWYYGKPCSSIYRSVHMISSKSFSEYTDFPMPEAYPTYARADQALAYLRDYARHHRVTEDVKFGCTVAEAVPVAGGDEWDVTLADGRVRRYRGLVVANGHLSHPRLPDYPGRFGGLQIHSSQYKTPDVLKDKRVLVVGAGNSGCDIAVEAVHHAREVIHSTRRGYYFWPKFLFGMPADAWAEWPLRLRLPLWARRLFGGPLLRLTTAGQPEQYGLPKPDHKLFESHFIINSTLFYHLGHGDLQAKGDVREMKGDRVVFADGSEAAVDVIVYATGFKLDFPFLSQRDLDWDKASPRLGLNMFDARHRNLFFVGLFQTSTGNWPLMDFQSQLLARYLLARTEAPAKAEALERKLRVPERRPNGGIRFARTDRHSIELEHFSYRQQLRKLMRGMPDRAQPSAPAPVAAQPAMDASVR